jgi:hypothetical protein
MWVLCVLRFQLSSDQPSGTFLAAAGATEPFPPAFQTAVLARCPWTPFHHPSSSVAASLARVMFNIPPFTGAPCLSEPNHQNGTPPGAPPHPDACHTHDAIPHGDPRTSHLHVCRSHHHYAQSANFASSPHQACPLTPFLQQWGLQSLFRQHNRQPRIRLAQWPHFLRGAVHHCTKLPDQHTAGCDSPLCNLVTRMLLFPPGDPHLLTLWSSA